MKTVCFLGHRKILINDNLVEKLNNLIESLIFDGATSFLFGNRSEFIDLCWDIVTKYKQKYNHIRRAIVRYDYLEFQQCYIDYLHKMYEDIITDKRMQAGKLSYIKRNQYMIDNSDIIIFFYDENSLANGTRIAYNYAVRKKKILYNVFCS